MSNLEHKLKGIVHKARNALDTSDVHEGIAVMSIIRAFKEEGWRNTSHYEEVNIAVDGNGIAYPAMRRGVGMMTGPEWYAAFEKEKTGIFLSWPHSKEKTWLSNAASLAARRASGMEASNE